MEEKFDKLTLIKINPDKFICLTEEDVDDILKKKPYFLPYAEVYLDDKFKDLIDEKVTSMEIIPSTEEKFTVNKIEKCEILGNCKPMKLSDFDLSKKLGFGGYGDVYLAKNKKTQELRAIKVVFLNRTNIIKADIDQELKINIMLNHPNIIKCYGSFRDEEKLYIVFEYASGGELYEELQKETRFSVEKTKKIIRDIVRALIYCHSLNICHRDLKPENIMIVKDKNGNDVYKIIDWGGGFIHRGKSIKGMRGTLDYLAPELISGKEYDCNKVDVWTVGVLTYELLVGKPPFEGENRNATFMRIARVDLQYPEYLSEECKTFMTKIFKSDPKKRPTMEQILNDPFLSN